MASFTDQIMQFNPYVQQLPVEAMKEVGMYKQQKYDEGIQKIQSYIDNIAGLAIVRDIDKKYVQSKLNELGNNLRKVAAADFSNFQVVNSVGGMANQIMKDKRVQNAVSSTARYQKSLSDREAYKKEGKSSPSNDYVFNQEANDWLYSDDIDKTYNGSYEQYTPWKKNAVEIIKALTKSKNITEDAFTLDENGKLVIADAIVRTELAGVSPEQIQRALMAGFTPADWKQMEIDGRYTYANRTPEQFSKQLFDDYSAQINALEEKRKALYDSKTTTTSVEEIGKIDNKIAEMDKAISSVVKQYDGIAGTLRQGDVEGAKANLYTTNQLASFGNAFAYTELTKEYKNSPFADMAMRREQMKQQWLIHVQDLNERIREFDITRRQKDRENDLREEANRLTKEGQGSPYGSLSTGVKESDVPIVTTGQIINSTNAALQAVEKADNDLMKRYKGDKTWLETQRQAWMKAPNGVDPYIAEHFRNTDEQRRLATTNMALVNDVNAVAEKKFGNLYSGIPADAKNVNIKMMDGSTMTFTPREFVDYNTKRSKYITEYTSTSPTTGATNTRTDFNDALAKKELSPKEYILYKSEKRKFERQGNSGDDVLVNATNQYYRSVNIPYQTKLKEKEDFILKEIQRRVTFYDPRSTTLPNTTPAEKDGLAGAFNQIAALAEDQKGGLANSPGFDVATLRKIATDPKVAGTIVVVPGTELVDPIYEVTAVGSDGLTTKFRLNQDMKRAVFTNIGEATKEIQAFRPYLEVMRKFNEEGDPNWTTSTNKERTNVANAYLNGPRDFPNVRHYGISGNIISATKGQTNSLRLNIFDPVSGKLYEDVPYPEMWQPQQVVPGMQRFDDALIFRLINGKIPTSADLKRVEKASQNPNR